MSATTTPAAAFTGPTPVPVTGPAGEPGEPTAAACVTALAGVAPGTFDCVQSNLGLLARLLHGTDAAAQLGRQLTVRSRPLGTGLHTFDPETAAEVGRSAALLGLAAVEDTGAETTVADTVSATSGVWYAIGDARSMPWLPYFEHAHMPHSFLVAASADPATALVIDAYDNQTEWGPAEPGSWHLPWSRLDFPARLWRWDAAEPVAPDRPGIERLGERDYLAAFTAHPDRAAAWQQLAVDSWLLARWHRQHALAWQAHRPADPAAAELAASTAADWQQLASQVFLGLRRVARGRPEPAGTAAEVERLLTQP